MSSEVCEPHHDLFGTLLTSGLIAGLFLSYLPQHLRIINKGSSEGFSPWFLLLGATSSAAGMMNMWTLQWGIVRCCRVLSAGSCLESLGGIIQVTMQWFLFNVILVLYLIYYPSHLKYTVVDIDTHDRRGIEHVKTNVRSEHWRLSITLSWVVAIHMAFIVFVTFFLVMSTKPTPTPDPWHNAQVSMWATFLGVTSAVLAAIQYLPQLVHTYRLKLVGALSIPMMVIQTPGAGLMVISIALRPGTDWTSWVMYAVSGIMQGILLIMCIAWKIRQKRLEVDDFGHPLSNEDDDVPAVRPGDTGRPISSAVDEAIEEDGPVPDMEIVRAMLGEDTPLLKNGKRRKSSKKSSSSSWLSNIRR